MKFKTLFTTYPVIVVYDTEFTTWEGAWERGWSGANEHRELVQIAAQKIDLQTGVVIDSFERLVQPQINQELSDYFVQLTGITQVEVDKNGVLFADMLKDFLSWSSDCTRYAYGPSMHNADADAAVLQENVELYGLHTFLDMEQFANVYHTFRLAGFDPAPLNSGRVFEYFDLQLDGHEHNAMFDVTSLVASLFEMKRRMDS